MGHARAAPNAIGDELLRLLPRDGGSIPNRAARALISKRLAQPVSNEAYFAARDRLMHDNIVGRVRGQGGSVFLVNDPLPTPPQAEPVAEPGPLERELMAPLQVALAQSFHAMLDLPRDSPAPIIEDISAKGPKKGVWARPDFVLVSVSRFSILPGAHVDTHVFELKNEAGGGLRAVHEALAQARFANYAHLVWYMPDGSSREPELDEVTAHCTLHGVGFLRLRREPTPALESLVDARRTPTTPLELDGFLESRLSGDSKQKLAEAIKRSR
ncbi:MAG: hypothetical protein ABL996_06370, partial [Micropepsaceae bacterium]